ncbi:MAG: hypothetical protein WC926_03060 [Candidatus Paceibacterota bacterium]|jgi:hypothetical protein
MDTIKECFDIILKGGKNDSRLAARQVRKLLYSARSGKDIYQDIEDTINKVPREYAKILEEWRQENFVTAISVIYFLHDKEENPDFLFPWLFQLLQHPGGVIRYAAVRMFENEIGLLTVHLRCPDYKQSKLKSERSDRILQSLFLSLNGLLTILWGPEYNKFKYIASLPASPYKSVQMVLSEMEESCGQEYFSHFFS